ncbi:phage portal protein [Corynebacterium amycolatum]|uniref:phage portal protein n=1 Tax=Corynebacterium amycolatum TaxID=43765 RepID=UPI00191EC32A|nr:phage portal protein [Corynebacterium amycolatum]QQU97793.1 phage portal protein [Corynebacterium amycolatum]
MIDGLSHDEENILGVLAAEVGNHQHANKKLASYYDGTHRVQRIGVAVPRTLADIGVVSGWPATVVDTYGDLLRMDGFISPDYPDEMRTITRRFNVPLRVSEAILDMLIFGLGLLAVEPDRDGDFRLRSVSPMSGSLLWDDATNSPVAGYRRSGVDSRGMHREVLYLHGEIVVITWDKTISKEVTRYQVPGGGFPMFRLRNRLRTSHWSGQSEITPPVQYLTDAAARTLENMEYNSEFYASPQRWATGASLEDFGLDPEGMSEFDRVEVGWRTSIGKMLVVNGDEDDQKQPSVGQFASSPPTPFIEQVRAYSQLIASESKIPAQYFGFMTENPPSGDSIRVWKEQLIRASEIKMELMNPDLIDMARVLVSISDNTADVDVDQLTDNIEIDWRDPATASKAADADWALKLLSAGVFDADSEVLLENLHFSAADRDRIRRENRGKRLAALARVLESAGGADTADMPAAPEQLAPGDPAASIVEPVPTENASDDAREGR